MAVCEQQSEEQSERAFANVDGHKQATYIEAGHMHSYNSLPILTYKELLCSALNPSACQGNNIMSGSARVACADASEFRWLQQCNLSFHQSSAD